MSRAYARPLAMPLALVALLAAPAARADWRFVPTLDVRETYTDNVALRPDNEKQGQFVTEITPGFLLRHKGPRLTVNAGFQLQYFGMQERDVEGINRVARNGQADLRAKLIDDLLYVDAAGSISNPGISPFGQLVDASNNYLAANRAQVKAWHVSPYLVHRFGNSANTELRYTRDEVDAGRVGLGNTQGDTLKMSANSGTAFRTWGWGVQLSGQKIHEELATDTNILNASATVRYRVTPHLNLTGTLGYDDYDYQSLGGATSGRAWNAGFAWAPSMRTSLQATLGRRYYGPSRSLTALHRSRHTVWSINYDDSVTSTRANFLLPAAIDTASMLDRLFTPNFADPAERAIAVQQYIRSAGLPASLANNVNFFSNRYSLQKQLRASMAYRESRTSAVVSLYRVRREALSVRTTDSPLLGTSINTINDDTEQTGVNASLNYRLSPRTYLNLISDIGRSESLTSGINSRISSVRFGMRHQLKAKLTGVLELRHIKGSLGLANGQSYTENAVTASLSMQL